MKMISITKNFLKQFLYKKAEGISYLQDRLALYTEFPENVFIENTNICNAQCIICPREKLTRPQGFMSLDLFYKIINEVSAYKDFIKRVHLHNFGEPLLDKKLGRRIAYAKQMGIRHTYIVTNASMLTMDVSIQLLEAGLDEMKISFYGTNEQEYSSIMRNLDFYSTLRNIKNFI